MRRTLLIKSSLLNFSWVHPLGKMTAFPGRSRSRILRLRGDRVLLMMAGLLLLLPPVVYVTHAQAEAYCAFVERKLPTEAQWEHAARLGAASETTPRTYPWKDPSLHASCTRGASRYLAYKGCTALPQPVDYSSADVTHHKLRNMASNVSEWVLDDWNTYAYCKGGTGYDSSCQKTGTVCPQCQADGQACAKSCQPDNLVICGAGTYSVFDKNTTEHVVRGGSYLHSRCFHRLFVRRKESTPRPEIGFRCAR